MPESLAEFKQELSQYSHNQQDRSFRVHLVESTLADYLYKLESTFQPGLGVGHTLIGLVYIDGKN